MSNDGLSCNFLGAHEQQWDCDNRIKNGDIYQQMNSRFKNSDSKTEQEIKSDAWILV